MTAAFVRIVADDLTGALDSAAPFARIARPVRILLGAESPRSTQPLAGVGISSESRNVDWPIAEQRVTQALQRLDAFVPPGVSPVNFAKLDSVLRGAPIAETRLRCALWQATDCLFAPAFVEMGRRTRDGHHEIQVDGAWAPADVHDLVSAFDDYGTTARVRRPTDDWALSGAGMVIGDAIEPGDLGCHVAAGSAATPRATFVWAGSRGLAEAIAGPAAPCDMPSVAVVINGTTHPNTARQLVAGTQAGCWQSTRLHDATDGAASAVDTCAAVRDMGCRLTLAAGQAVFVVGGDTLSALLAGAEAVSLACIGEVASGVPISRIEGGRLDGVTLISKSGGFGTPDLFVRLLAADPR